MFNNIYMAYINYELIPQSICHKESRFVMHRPNVYFFYFITVLQNVRVFPCVWQCVVCVREPEYRLSEWLSPDITQRADLPILRQYVVDIT